MVQWIPPDESPTHADAATCTGCREKAARLRASLAFVDPVTMVAAREGLTALVCEDCAGALSAFLGRFT